MRFGPYIFWAVITLLVFGWHIFWWGMLEPAPLPTPLVSASSGIRYLPIPPDSKDPRLKEILAPLIFSTPSAAGFSQPLLEKGAQSVPPLRVVQDMSVSLPRHSSPVVNSGTVRSADFLADVQRQLQDVAFEIQEVDPFSSVPERADKVVRWEGALDGAAIQHSDVPASWGGLTNRRWEARLEISFDEKGMVGPVFFVGTEPAEICTPVLQWAKRLRAAPSDKGPRRTRVTIQVTPRAN